MLINLGYGKIKEEFYDQDYVRNSLSLIIKDVDFSRYSIPGGGVEIKNAASSLILGSAKPECVATSISTNLSFFIFQKFFANRIHVFLPVFSNYLRQIAREPNERVVFHEIDNINIEKIDILNPRPGDIFLFILPNNPSGELLKADDLIAVIKKIFENGAYALIDISWYKTIDYLKFGYTRDFFEKCIENYNTVLLAGLTKITGLTSLRCSCVLAKPDVINKFIRYHDDLAISCGAIDEALFSHILNNKMPVNWDLVNRHTRANNEILVNALRDSDLKFSSRQYSAGIFSMFYLEDGFNDSEKIAKICIENGLLVYPSSMFEYKNNGFRINLGEDSKYLQDGLDVLIKIIKQQL